METDKNILETMVSVFQRLEKEGFTTQFKATEHGLLSLDTEKVYKPEEIRVETFYRFEGESNPDDSSIIYAIVTDSGEKGTLTDSYSNYSDINVGEYMKQVKDVTKRD